ncbi:glycosyltransferase family 4 protein [Bradyrhizobium sp. CW10]|uniref:glycosyltransferase family 4 protein n=1 Tax=Bradyrhizobium sp. CW10 TaxID=2782683 RepID=UPI001FFC16C1|nr:glycosyltransferase family 4 protein [Bradyrhizobium sp. CW10]MCK1468412.1 glycosyltransferase family 4 protein [Bradyrhizobium sp. CW10]
MPQTVENPGSICSSELTLPKERVSVVYHFFPHYRAPILEELARSQRYQFEFWGAIDGIYGIEAFKGSEQVKINELKFKADGLFGRSVSGYWPIIFDVDVRAIIILGDPNIRSTWVIAVVGRLLRKKILFWTHGWLKPENKLKAKIRNLYFSLADRVLTYDDRAIEIARSTGFPTERITPIYNSLDWGRAREISRALQASDLSRAREEMSSSPTAPILICTARLTSLCRFDLLIEAASLLKKENFPVTLVLVGDGPERERLQARADALTVPIRFMGALYDEEKLGRFISAADVTVSPGKVGLTAMHSLMYGTPVITHDDRDAQMPEVEAIRPGFNGAFFRRDDARDLAAVIKAWIEGVIDRSAIRQRCQKVIEERYNPVTQRKLIEEALTDAGLQ